MFQRALYNEFRRGGIDKQVATVVSQALDDRDDPDLEKPAKPSGSFMGDATTFKDCDRGRSAVAGLTA